MEFDITNLKKVRKELGLTQKQFSNLCGLSQSYITKIESGHLDPSYTNAKKIINSLENLLEKKQIKAIDLISKKIISVRPDDTIKKAVIMMKKYEISQLPVIIDNSLVGYINEKLLIESITDSSKKTISDVMAMPPPIIDENASLAQIKDILKYWPLILIMKNRKFKGIITKSDLLNKLIAKN